jgi:hypothetical protein
LPLAGWTTLRLSFGLDAKGESEDHVYYQGLEFLELRDSVAVARLHQGS